MKKKSPRDIPDFSRKRPPAKDAGASQRTPAKPPARGAPPPSVKPQMPASKSGHRGQ